MKTPALQQTPSGGSDHRLVQRLRLALADAIRRPMGVIPDSATGLVTWDELAAAEKRRIKTTEPQRKRLREKAESMRKRMEEKGAEMLPDHIQAQTLRECSQSADGRFVMLPPTPYGENTTIHFSPLNAEL